MIQALQQELVLRRDECRDDIIETIYFGGGTPSLLEVSTLEALIATVYNNYRVGEQPEITLEANPDDLSADMLRQLAQSPINRLSIGVQSFFDDDLRWMNRAHNAQEAEYGLATARRYFNNISIDLIYGIPGMDNLRWQENIDKALDLGVPHISGYALTVEPRTALHTFIEKGIQPNVDDTQTRDQFYMLVECLEQEGYIHYEISNFGKPGFFSRNNSLYWQGKKYLGIGPSAHSFNGIQRSWNIKNNIKYIKALAKGQRLSTTEQLTPEDRYNEYIMTGLRTIWGVSLQKIREDFGAMYWTYINRQAKKHIDAQLLCIDHDVLKATRKGKFLIDGIASDLFILPV